LRVEKSKVVLGSLAANVAALIELEGEALFMRAARSAIRVEEFTESEPAVLPVAGVVDVDLEAAPSTWLMLINWSSWFSEIICPTIAVESMGAVGSWFCNSLTRRFRNVVPAVVPSRPPVEVVEVLDVVFAVAAFAFALRETAFALRRFSGDKDVLAFVAETDIFSPSVTESS
jgi:hypothetical protein